MKFIISPSKTMAVRKSLVDTPKIAIKFTEKHQNIISHLKNYSCLELKKLYRCSDKIANIVKDSIENFENLESHCAINYFSGTVFKQLECETYSLESQRYLSKNILILSAMYGILSPSSAIKFYRLDIHDQLKIHNQNLYEFWQSSITDTLKKWDDEVFINLASIEYSQMIDRKVFPNIVSIDFKQRAGSDLKSISSQIKKARGKFLNFCIMNCIESVNDLQKFDALGYTYSSEHSTKRSWIFVK